MNRYKTTRGIRFDEATLGILEKNRADYYKETGKQITVSEYIRSLIHRDSLKNMIEDVDYHSLKDMRKKIAGIGTNINQLSHRNNSEIFSLDDLERMRNELDEIHSIYQILTSIIEKY